MLFSPLIRLVTPYVVLLFVLISPGASQVQKDQPSTAQPERADSSARSYVPTVCTLCMKNGQTARVLIKDTIGCKITILRGGQSAVIRKQLIRFIVCNHDSINYEKYVCNDQPKKPTYVSETAAYKLAAMLDGIPKVSQEIASNCRIAIVRDALQGSSLQYADSQFEKTIIPVLAKTHPIVFLPADSVLAFTSRQRNSIRYVFLTRQFANVHAANSQTAPGMMPGLIPGASMSITMNFNQIFTVGEFYVLDLATMQVVFYLTLAEEGNALASVGPGTDPIKMGRAEERANSTSRDNVDYIIDSLRTELLQSLSSQ